MDQSEKYLKMCEQAQEIQDLRKYNGSIRYGLGVGDYYWIKRTDTICILEEGGIGSMDSIWIPRQDQLQEIILEKIDVFEIDSFLFHLIEYTKEEQPWYNSFEQLLLGYVMRFKFNKIWNGENEKWI